MTEDQLEQETLAMLVEVGYQYGYGPDFVPDPARPAAAPERANYAQVLLPARLESAIARLNPHMPASAHEDALQRISHLDTPVLLAANRQFHHWLIHGVPVEYQTEGETRGDFVRLLDFADPKANQWLAVNQLSIRGPRHTRRPDIILYLNGLPLVVLELKNPVDEQADIWRALQQLDTYKEQIPDLFHYNELLVISDGSQARLGSLSAKAERFMAWRTIDGATLDPLGQFNQLETLVRGILAPTFLLDFLRFFVLFEDDGKLVKKIAGYHQFHAVRAAIGRVLEASRPGGSHKGGVVWHTQGSGKSITMVCFAARVMRETALENPTVLVITDRNDLDSQLFGVFSLAQGLLREQPVQCTSRQDLRDKLANRPSGGIVFATIQKFMPGEQEAVFPLLSARHNIVVIADEAHRTQYGFEAKIKALPRQQDYASLTTVTTATKQVANDPKHRKVAQERAPYLVDAVAPNTLRYQLGYAQHLRDALPNATFVAFTGTPVAAQDRDTRAVFGDYIHIYDMQQACADGATVPIYYESRLARLGLKEGELDSLDEEVDALAEDEEESQQALLKSRWTQLAQVVGAAPRIKQIALDLVNHFEERNKAQSGKAMVVAMSREICCHLYDAITLLRPEWHDADPELGAIKIVMTGASSDKALLRPHIYSKQVKKRLEQRFKDPQDSLQLVIVRDMWLTGFDAPCVHTLYVDKPMKGHNLMQAIARVNRVFRDKQGGLVVDYIGIASDLKLALKEYTASNGRGRPTVDAHEAYARLEERLDVLRALLHGCVTDDFLSGGHKVLARAANHVLGLDDGKKRFCDNALAMSQAFTLCCTLDEAKAVREEVAFLQAVKIVLTKQEQSEQKLTDQERELAIRQIIASAVVSDQVVDIFHAVGLDKPNIGILDDEFLNEVRALPERNLAVELLQRLLEGEIKARFASNVVQQDKFSALLARVITRYQNRSIETAQVVEELIAMAKKFREEAARGAQLGLNADEVAFYDALADNEESVRALGDDTLKKIAHELATNLRQNASVDWAMRESVRASLRLMVKRILRKYKYPPVKTDAAVELVLRQAERLCEAW